ncbi:hypothetical protein, probably cold-shock inducible [Desulfotalea psychrophila LSv54]|uniref:SF3 helicase domain-containing protein n=2 Tax=Desulfotalea psychrophila TaxID=84980 RepID=Q6ARW7_DESPS|nr:hypothetical protein, probably cold-shock inducible [Desulfotalea psychrophila LSv54]
MGMIEFTPLTEAQNMLYEATVSVAKEEVHAEADRIRQQYMSVEAIKLAEKTGVDVEHAEETVRLRCNGHLSPEDIIYFQNGSTATVEEMLADRSKYDGTPCADPLEREEGLNRAMFYANADTGKPLIHSFLHGGQIHHLTGRQEEPVEEHAPSFSELLERAATLKAGDTKGMKDILELATALDSIEEQELLRKIKKNTGMPLQAMRSYTRKGQVDSKDLDHLDIARKLLEEIGKENVLNCEDGVFIWREKGVWEPMRKGELKHRLQKLIEGKMRVMSQWVVGATEVFTNDVYRANHEFNIGDPNVINCLNGELHLNHKTGSWEPKSHDKLAYRTSQIPVEFDPTATAPRFKQFLNEIFETDEDSQDKTRALLEMCGYTMVAHCSYELFVILIGTGANGKSVFLSLLEAIVGPKNTVGVQPSQFDNRFQRGHMRHKLANIVTEIKQGEVIADAELKGIVSGEPSTVENKFKDPFTMRPHVTCWFATNHMPHTRDFSEALFRRALILKFNRVFSDEEKNPKLKDELFAELPGILNLALHAYANAVLNGFTKPDSSEQAKEEWRLEADQVQQFVEDCCEKSPYEEIESSTLFRAYRSWAETNGIRKMLSQKSFRDRLTRLGFGSKRNKQARLVTGIAMANNFPGSAADLLGELLS